MLLIPVQAISSAWTTPRTRDYELEQFKLKLTCLQAPATVCVINPSLPPCLSRIYTSSLLDRVDVVDVMRIGLSITCLARPIPLVAPKRDHHQQLPAPTSNR